VSTIGASSAGSIGRRSQLEGCVQTVFFDRDFLAAFWLAIFGFARETWLGTGHPVTDISPVGRHRGCQEEETANRRRSDE